MSKKIRKDSILEFYDKNIITQETPPNKNEWILCWRLEYHLECGSFIENDKTYPACDWIGIPRRK